MHAMYLTTSEWKYGSKENEEKTLGEYKYLSVSVSVYTYMFVSLNTIVIVEVIQRFDDAAAAASRTRKLFHCIARIRLFFSLRFYILIIKIIFGALKIIDQQNK